MSPPDVDEPVSAVVNVPRIEPAGRPPLTAISVECAKMKSVPLVTGMQSAVSSITGRLIKGSIWLSLSRAVVNLLATLSTFVLAWYLTPSDFGLVALATTMLLIVTTVTELSLTQALIRHEAPQEAHFSAAWTLNATRDNVVEIDFDVVEIEEHRCRVCLCIAVDKQASPRRVD